MFDRFGTVAARCAALAAIAVWFSSTAFAQPALTLQTRLHIPVPADFPVCRPGTIPNEKDIYYDVVVDVDGNPATGSAQLGGSEIVIRYGLVGLVDECNPARASLLTGGRVIFFRHRASDGGFDTVSNNPIANVGTFRVATGPGRWAGRALDLSIAAGRPELAGLGSQSRFQLAAAYNSGRLGAVEFKNYDFVGFAVAGDDVGDEPGDVIKCASYSRRPDRCAENAELDAFVDIAGFQAALATSVIDTGSYALNTDAARAGFIAVRSAGDGELRFGGADFTGDQVGESTTGKQFFTVNGALTRYALLADVGAPGDPVALVRSTTVPTLRTQSSEVTTRGEFAGDRGQAIRWTILQEVSKSSVAYAVTYLFETDDRLGALTLVDFADIAPEGDTQGRLRVYGNLERDYLELVTTNGAGDRGLSHSTAYRLARGATFSGFAANRPADLTAALQAGTQSFDRAGTIGTGLPAAGTASDGSRLYGPADVATAYAYRVDPNARSASIYEIAVTSAARGEHSESPRLAARKPRRRPTRSACPRARAWCRSRGSTAAARASSSRRTRSFRAMRTARTTCTSSARARPRLRAPAATVVRCPVGADLRVRRVPATSWASRAAASCACGSAASARRGASPRRIPIPPAASRSPRTAPSPSSRHRTGSARPTRMPAATYTRSHWRATRPRSCRGRRRARPPATARIPPRARTGAASRSRVAARRSIRATATARRAMCSSPTSTPARSACSSAARPATATVAIRSSARTAASSRSAPPRPTGSARATARTSRSGPQRSTTCSRCNTPPALRVHRLPVLSGDGRYVAYATPAASGATAVRVTDVATARGVDLFESSLADPAIAVAPDGARVFAAGAGVAPKGIDLALAAGAAPTRPIDDAVTGAWFDPQQSGQGFSFEHVVLGGQAFLVASWFTYTNGRAAWLVGAGPVRGETASIDFVTARGGGFPPAFDPARVQRTPWGRATVRFYSADRARVDWSTNEGGYSKSSLGLARLTRPKSSAQNIAGAGVDACYTGSWANPAQDGHGFVLQVIPIGASADSLVAVWYVFEPDGSPMWLLGQAPIENGRAVVPFTRFTGALFPPAYSDSQVRSEPWGTATFEFRSPSAIDVSWRPNDPRFGSGSLALSRVTEAPPYRSCR